jgi:hypothetical protein
MWGPPPPPRGGGGGGHVDVHRESDAKLPHRLPRIRQDNKAVLHLAARTEQETCLRYSNRQHAGGSNSRSAVNTQPAAHTQSPEPTQHQMLLLFASDSSCADVLRLRVLRTGLRTSPEKY